MADKTNISNLWEKQFESLSLADEKEMPAMPMEVQDQEFAAVEAATDEPMEGNESYDFVKSSISNASAREATGQIYYHEENDEKKKEDDVIIKEHINIVFIGHVDAGKSTIGGMIMSLTGAVDKRTLDKFMVDAKSMSRESWYLSWALDTCDEEREKGKTVEVGRASFETATKHYNILDAPGHKCFIPNMIGGAAQADIAVLVISARKGEFETGFEKGGQTREHAMLARTAGVKQLIVVINKMDDQTVNWSENRYKECCDKLLPFLKQLGFSTAKDLTFMPVSGINGTGLQNPVPEDICPYYKGPSFFQFLDSLPPLDRNFNGVFLMPIVDKFRDMGMFVMGKVESGKVKKGQQLLVMPNKTQVTVDQILLHDKEVGIAICGQNIKIKLKGIEEEEISPGFVLCEINSPAKIGKVFNAHVVILSYKNIICAGFTAIMHIHCLAEEVAVKELLYSIDKKTGKKSKTKPRFVKQDGTVVMKLECAGVICFDEYTNHSNMGRFTLRDDGKTIAIGKVIQIIG